MERPPLFGRRGIRPVQPSCHQPAKTWPATGHPGRPRVR